jgi:hypothetical protein
MMGLPTVVDSLKRLELVLLRVLVTVVGHIAASVLLDSSMSHGSFLVVAIEILDVKAASSLVIAELGIRTRLKSLVLPAGSPLGV